MGDHEDREGKNPAGLLRFLLNPYFLLMLAAGGFVIVSEEPWFLRIWAPHLVKLVFTTFLLIGMVLWSDSETTSGLEKKIRGLESRLDALQVQRPR